MSVNLKQLNPIVFKNAELAIKELDGIVFITQGFRTLEEQDKLYKKRPKVTNAPAGWSYHNYGLAIDIAFNKPYPLYPRIDAKIWETVANVFKKYGFSWGASFGDYPHFEMTFGLTIKQLLTGVKPPTSMPSLSDRFRGEFLLAVDQGGAIYYVTKSKGTKKRIPAGMSIEEFIRKVGDVTGIKNSDLNKIPND